MPALIPFGVKGEGELLLTGVLAGVPVFGGGIMVLLELDWFWVVGGGLVCGGCPARHLRLLRRNGPCWADMTVCANMKSKRST
jgi:hypothetical protein